MELDEALLETEEAMEKAVGYLKHELQGIRTGRANTSLVEYVKIDYHGSPTDLRSLALISVQDATQLMIKPFDPGSLQMIVKGIQASGLGLNPVAEGKQIRISVPALSGERRRDLINKVRELGEQAKVTIRNARRDGNKHIDAAGKDKEQHLSEDDVAGAKDEVQELTKKYEAQVEEAVEKKAKEIEDV